MYGSTIQFVSISGLSHEEEYPPPRVVKVIKDAIYDSVRVWTMAMAKLSRQNSLDLFPDLNNSSRWQDGQEIYEYLYFKKLIRNFKNI